jgi:hypothetical protein
MKAKRPLLLVVLTLVLLAVALALPAAAFGKPAANTPVSWVKVNTNYWLEGGFHGSTEANVQKLANGELRGQVVVKVFRESYDGGQTWFHYVVKTGAFTSPLYWDAPESPFPLAHSDFFIANPGNCPAGLGIDPTLWASYKGAAVADFVAYVPRSQYPKDLPWIALYPPETPSVPLRFMFIDSCKPGKPDVMLNWLFVGDPVAPWMPTIWTVPIQSGNVQVHVGK